MFSLRTDVLDSEFCGIETSMDPKFPPFSFEVDHNFASTAARDNAERHGGFKPK